MVHGNKNFIRYCLSAYAKSLTPRTGYYKKDSLRRLMSGLSSNSQTFPHRVEMRNLLFFQSKNLKPNTLQMRNLSLNRIPACQLKH